MGVVCGSGEMVLSCSHDKNKGENKRKREEDDSGEFEKLSKVNFRVTFGELKPPISRN